MNVPPLMTAAVKATANAPSERFPRKYFSRKLPFRCTRLATTPSPSEITVNRPRAIRVGGCAWIACALFIEPSRADLRLEVGRVVLAEVVVGHDEAGEPEREHPADGPGDHDPPEDPRRHPQDRADVLDAEGTPLADVAEQVAVAAAVGGRGEPGQADDDRLASRVLQDGVGLWRHDGDSPGVGRRDGMDGRGGCSTPGTSGVRGPVAAAHFST